MEYFTSDCHFYHENIIKYCSRPYKNAEEMNIKMIENWNSIISNNDKVYVLGDFLMAKSKKQGELANEILRKLNGEKFLIIGNHDYFLKNREFDQNLFTWIKDYTQIYLYRYKFVLFHYPIHEWSGSHRDDVIHLYGHVHNTVSVQTEYMKKFKKAFNVGVDVNNFFPVSAKQIIEVYERSRKTG